MSGDGTKEVLVSEEELRSLKCCLCKRLRSAGRPLTPHLTASIERALKEGVSSSFIVFAPKTAVVSEGERIIQAVRGYGERLRLVRLRGAVFGRDEKALVSIADQLVALLDSGDAVESLQALEHFLLSSQATPTVLLLEDVQEFCRRDRQFLLYSLLDLMHSKAVNFVFVGLTHNVQVQELLEKRVSSRLNASYVYVSRSSAEEVLSCLKQTLRIEDEMEEKEMNKSEVKRKRRRQEEEEANCNFAHDFNEQMSSLLADISLKALVAERVEWGHDLNFFLNAFESCVTGLTPANPFVTTNALLDAMRQAEPQSLYHIVSGLPRLDVTLLIAITRLKARGETASSGCNDAAFTVLRVLTDFDALSNGVYDIQHDYRDRLVQGLLRLESLGLLSINCGGRRSNRRGAVHHSSSLPSNAAITLLPDPVQIQSLFLPNRSKNILGAEEVIRVSARIRDALFNPLLPIVKTLSTSSC